MWIWRLERATIENPTVLAREAVAKRVEHPARSARTRTARPTVAVVILVLPLRTRRVLRVAMRAHVEAVSTLVDHATETLLGVTPTGGSIPRSGVTLRSDARNVDATYQAVVATALPLRRTLFGEVDDAVGSALRLAAASRNYGRNLVADVGEPGALDADTCRDVADGGATLRRSIAVVATALTGSRDGTYVRSASIYDRAERRLETSPNLVGDGQLAIRDLKLIDGAVGRLAGLMHVAVTDYDTVDVEAPVGAVHGRAGDAAIQPAIS